VSIEIASQLADADSADDIRGRKPEGDNQNFHVKNRAENELSLPRPGHRNLLFGGLGEAASDRGILSHRGPRLQPRMGSPRAVDRQIEPASIVDGGGVADDVGVKPAQANTGVGSPILRCQRSTGSWLVMVERRINAELRLDNRRQVLVAGAAGLAKSAKGGNVS